MPFYDNAGEIGLFEAFLFDSFFCKKWSKMMKTTLVFLKQPRMNTFSLSEAAKLFFGRKNTNDKQDRNKKSKQILPQRYFLKMLKFDPFLGFPNFQNQFFLSFLVFHQKKIFFVLQTYFCFPKKISRLVSQIQPKFLTLFFFFFGGGGGGEKRHLFSPPKNPKVRFRQHCRKTT